MSFYVFANGLQITILRTNQEQFNLKDWEKLRTANLSLNFTGSYKKECIRKLILDVKAEATDEDQRVMLKSLLTPIFIINFTGSYEKECILKLILDLKAETTSENQMVMLKSLLTPFFTTKRNSLGWGMVWFVTNCYRRL